MVFRFRLIPLALLAWVSVAPIAAQGPLGGQTAADRHKSGHSKLGEAFDEGPRERPTKIEGIGRTTFPITTSKPEVQEWFNQGHTLLHSFWFFEAERSFRWAVKLDPDAPMPYWGLARTTYGDRARAFLREASSRKQRGTERERDYIAAWEVQYEEGVERDAARKNFQHALERLILKYPDDVEAKALYAHESMQQNRVGTELLIRELLAVPLDPKLNDATRFSPHWQFKGRNVILVFYLGTGCAHCVSQIKDLSERSDKWKGLDADVVAVSSDTVESNAASQGSMTVRLLADDQFKNARLFKSFDDFEEMPIHSTVLIDKTGRVHWARHGGGPFTDYDFLAAQLERMNALAAKASSSPASSAPRH